MLKRKYLNKCFGKLWKAAITHLYAFSETKDIEELHRLRVEIKKIFSLIALQQFKTLKPEFPNYIKFARTIFSKAGKIRNIQLALQINAEYSGKDSNQSEMQRSKLASLINEFSPRTAVYVELLRETERVLLRNTCDIENSRIFNWYEEELQKLARVLIDKKNYQKNMHEARITIKKLLYVYSFLHKKTREKLNLDKRYLCELEEKIGKWHDTAVSVKILSDSGFMNSEARRKLFRQRKNLLKICWKLSKHFKNKIDEKRMS